MYMLDTKSLTRLIGSRDNPPNTMSELRESLDIPERTFRRKKKNGFRKTEILAICYILKTTPEVISSKIE